MGKWTGIKADVFSVGMGPVILSRVDKNGTTWQIAAIPFGGFVKFKGDANISSSHADFRSKALNKNDLRTTCMVHHFWPGLLQSQQDRYLISFHRHIFHAVRIGRTGARAVDRK